MESTRTLATDRSMEEKTLSDEEANVPSGVTEEPSLEYDVNKVYSVWSPQQKRLALLAGGLLSFIYALLNGSSSNLTSVETLLESAILAGAVFVRARR